MGKPIGEITHWRNKNVEDLPRQLEYTNPWPWRDPYKGIHKGGGRRPPPFVEAAEGRLLYMGLSMGMGSCIRAAWVGLPRFYYANVGFFHIPG